MISCGAWQTNKGVRHERPYLLIFSSLYLLALVQVKRCKIPQSSTLDIILPSIPNNPSCLKDGDYRVLFLIFAVDKVCYGFELVYNVQ